MAPIQSCLVIEKYKRHCALKSAAYMKHLQTTDGTLGIFTTVLLTNTPPEEEEQATSR